MYSLCTSTSRPAHSSSVLVFFNDCRCRSTRKVHDSIVHHIYDQRIVIDSIHKMRISWWVDVVAVGRFRSRRSTRERTSKIHDRARVVRETLSRIFPLTSLPRHEKMIYSCRYIILNGQPKLIPVKNHVPQNDVEPAESTATTLPPQYRCRVEKNAAHNLQRLFMDNAYKLPRSRGKKDDHKNQV